MRVKLNRQSVLLPLYLVLGKAAPLLGREWLCRICLDWREIKTVRTVHYTNEGTLNSLLKRYDKVFREDLGTFNGYTATLNLNRELNQDFSKHEWYRMPSDPRWRKKLIAWCSKVSSHLCDSVNGQPRSYL